MPDALEQIASELMGHFQKSGQLTQQICISTISRVSKIFSLSSMPQLSQLLPLLPPSAKKLLVKKPVRSASGVQVLAVMCRPHRCPHQVKTGKNCTYCGGGADSDFNYSSQSYTGYEPTSMRAIRARYDPIEQTKVRLNQLRELGHDSGKYEVVLMGGTFMSLPQEYRESFICGILQGITGHVSTDLSEQIQFAARSSCKMVALTLETRPDYCEPRHLAQMLRYGTTRLEIGVQSVYQDVIAAVNRGHTIRSVVRCFGQSRDAGFKMIAHMMPNLVHTSVNRDLWGFRELFESLKFRPDGLKVYPTLVIRGTELYEQWRQEKYTRNYPHHTLINLLADILSIIPPYVRIYRIMRDIPLPLITSGVEAANLRELALAELTRRGQFSMEIRQREAGISQATSEEIERKTGLDRGFTDFKTHKLEVVRRDYAAGGSVETFISAEQPGGVGCHPPILVGLLRLRQMPLGKRKGGSIRKELQGRVSIIREVHVYGSAVGVNERGFGEQHRGIGRLLVEEACQVAKNEHHSAKLVVISGVGTREYYQKLGFVLDGVYMSKML
ncbi:Histone_acetyltransferase Elp3 [Hexamita inflata]|uniref:Elongator complex protein 3 n=1 Tax=Hexamita inflata TaxID=28002 RepID=A0AA86NYC6_9EUKA|nr:Histone acetyltransferase Elp3 [Hexamita inflata]